MIVNTLTKMKHLASELVVTTLVKPMDTGVDLTPQGGCGYTQNTQLCKLTPSEHIPHALSCSVMPLLPEKFLPFAQTYSSV